VKVTLLGPQRRPTLDRVVASLAPGQPVATITAGWQEREGDDAELSTLLGYRDVNLRLYQRWCDLQDRDPDFAAAERSLTEVLDEAQALYLLRLDNELRAVHAIQRRSGGTRLQADILAESVGTVRELDAAHLSRVDEIRGEFYRALQPHDRPVIAAHRAEVAALLADCSALVVTGGHVGALAHVLHLFNVAAALRSPVVAWSAGAMALAERIVLFHDRAPQGPGHPEVYASGLSILRGIVPLPHARARLLLDDRPRMAVFAARFAPATCVLLENGTRLEIDGQDGLPPAAQVLAADGRVRTLAAA
jgi:hypothetical protein